MADKETVITHLQIINTWASFARERDLQFFTAKHMEDIAQWADDAINLLKEQEDTINELQNAYGYLQKQFFEAQDKLLKEQPEIVRCKDCMHFDGCDCKMNDIVNIMDTEWFCADGERRTDDA